MIRWIIGAGAAGYFCAIHTKSNHPSDDVILIEKSENGLAKVKISGGGRCNVTHACFDPRHLSEFYPRGGKALIGPFQTFQPKDTMSWFERHGVPLKIEHDGRVFPQSDLSQSVIDALVAKAQTVGVKVWTTCSVNQIVKKPTGGFEILLERGIIHHADTVALCTGSSRQGYELAKGLGHSIVTPIPSLFTFKINDPDLVSIPGVAVNRVLMTVVSGKSWKQVGPILVTHWGFSGPATIKLSAWAARDFADSNYHLPLAIKWLPELNDTELDTIISNQQRDSKKWVTSKSLFSEIPARLWEYLVKKSIGNGHIPWNETGKKQKARLIDTLLRDSYEIGNRSTNRILTNDHTSNSKATRPRSQQVPHNTEAV